MHGREKHRRFCSKQGSEENISCVCRAVSFEIGPRLTCVTTELTAVWSPIVVSFPIWVARFLLGLADLAEVRLEFITCKQKITSRFKCDLTHANGIAKLRQPLAAVSTSRLASVLNENMTTGKLNANVLKVLTVATQERTRSRFISSLPF